MYPVRHLLAVPARPAAQRLSVVIADDHAVMRRSLRQLLEGTAGIDVAAEAGDLALTGQHVAAHRPDVLVLDLNMPDGSGLELVEEVHRLIPLTHVVVTSVEDTPAFVQRAFAAGASGYVLKDHADTELPEAVSAASRGEHYTSPVLARRPTEMRRRGLLAT
jgi:two-component system response regulator NreC